MKSKIKKILISIMVIIVAMFIKQNIVLGTSVGDKVYVSYLSSQYKYFCENASKHFYVGTYKCTSIETYSSASTNQTTRAKAYVLYHAAKDGKARRRNSLSFS